MTGYDPFDQGYMHDWRLEEAVKEGVRRALQEGDLKASSGIGPELLQAVRALIREMELAREDAEVREALWRMVRNPRRDYDEEF